MRTTRLKAVMRTIAHVGRCSRGPSSRVKLSNSGIGEDCDEYAISRIQR